MDMFTAIGSFGPWQRYILAVFFYVNLIGIWQNLAMTFFAPNIPFRCIEPTDELAAFNETTFDNSCEVPVNSTNTSVPCTRWQYDHSFYPETIVSKWDLVCDREWLISLTNSVYMIGFLFSVLIFGQISDSFGRFPTVVICFVFTIVSMFATLKSVSFNMFLILRFLQAFGRTGLATVGIVLVLEIVGPQHRTETGVVIQIGWAAGFSTLAAVAWFFKDWFWLQMALSVPYIPLVLAYWLVPESPRWLLAKGKTKELQKLLKKAAKMNGKELKIDAKDIQEMENKAQENQKSETIFYVLKWPRMRIRVLNLYYSWFVNSFLYYGLSFHTNDLAGDPYLNFTLAGLLEFPSYLILYWGIKKRGRRPMLAVLMLVAAASCVAISAVPQDLSWLRTSFAMLGKFCVTGSFGLLYIYTSELFPTVVRNITVGSCSMSARVGSIIAPFVRELGKVTHPVVPNLLFGFLALTSGLLGLLLPETKDQKLPDTLEDGENFGEFPKEKNDENTRTENTFGTIRTINTH
ncbi:unnamed protein product [Larinioides sclopetarius]|uniref:Major facilitator superfamily (MFS) profile domain-containing protein n=1 Tax=Larinioides sclopetarius TaxID=280406 RepID=A0AAV2BJR0_9ARAC